MSRDMAKPTKWVCAQPSEDSDQPGHLPSLIRIFAVCMEKPWVLSYPWSAQRRLRSNWADAQADLSLRWAHSLCWFCHVVAHVFARFILQYEESWVNNIWATTHQNVSSGVSDQARHNRPAHPQKLARDIILSTQRTTKVLIRLRWWAGWSAPLLFAYDVRHIFSWPGSFAFHFF